MPKTCLADVVNCGEVLVSVIEVNEALTHMGLTVSELHGVIDAGEIDRDTCNFFNPPSDAENRAHGTSTRVLRETLIPKGWHYSNSRHFCTTISPDRAIEIVVGSGDFATGNPILTPQTEHPKGDMMLAGVSVNQRQLSFPFCNEEAPQSSLSGPITWVLLRHRHEQIVRCELSIPTSMALDDRVVFKGTRIILPDLDLNPSGGVRSHDDGPSGLEVPVLRRRQA
jgi:hypothetical protein